MSELTELRERIAAKAKDDAFDKAENLLDTAHAMKRYAEDILEKANSAITSLEEQGVRRNPNGSLYGGSDRKVDHKPNADYAEEKIRSIENAFRYGTSYLVNSKRS